MKHSIVKAILMKRHEKLNPNQDDPIGMLGTDEHLANLQSGDAAENGEDPVEEAGETLKQEKDEGNGDPNTLTIKLVDEDAPDAEHDLAPGAPANPKDEHMDGQDMHSKLIDAIMGGHSEEDVKGKRGGLNLRGKVRQAALKMK